MMVAVFAQGRRIIEPFWMFVFMKQLLLTSLLLILTACSRSSAHEKTVKSMKTIESWAATAQMVGETWQQGSLPDAYAQQTLQKSQEEITQEVKGLTDSPSLSLLQPLQQTLQQMITTVQQHQKAAIVSCLQQFSHQRQQLDALVKKGEQS